jgi:amino acid adenylation domain-containing protein
MAIVDGAGSISYSDLERRANKLGHLLVTLGVKHGDRVGVYLDKSIESVVAIYGALKAGAIYVPLDPDAPPTRLACIARDCAIKCLLTQSSKAPQWAELLAAGAPLETLVTHDGAADAREHPAPILVVGSDAPAAQPDYVPKPATRPDDLAYLLYTSGSTGSPKGVMLSHSNALAFVEWAATRFDIRTSDRLSSHAPFHFDLSIFDLFAAASAGATVVLVPPEASLFPVDLVRFIDRTRITVWYSVPSVLSMLALRGGMSGSELPLLRAVLFAGEVFPTKHLRRMMQLLAHARFYNLYGPTETNVCTYYEVPLLPEDMMEPIPIGKPIANVDVFGLTDDGTLARPGEVGELYVRGPTVMQGYWGDTQRTAAVLVPDPTRPAESALVYRTGDLVRARNDGNYLFLGRRDNQIKTRGYRVELGEIETTLLAHRGIVECAVRATPDEIITNRIRAFLVLNQEVDEDELISFLSERLPHYMIPESFHFLDSLPKTSTGKIDRQRLGSGGQIVT